MRALSLGLVLGLLPATLAASELVYQPVNPGFGGSPFNSDYLLGTAAAQDDFEHEQSERDFDLSQQEQFTRTLQSRLLSSLAGQVTDAIFGEEARDEGTFRYDDQVVSFVRGLETITIDIFNETTGERTEIAVPTTSVEP